MLVAAQRGGRLLWWRRVLDGAVGKSFGRQGGGEKNVRRWPGRLPVATVREMRMKERDVGVRNEKEIRV